MKLSTIVSALLLSLTAAMGVSQDGCLNSPRLLPDGLRGRPPIEVGDVAGETLRRTFSVQWLAFPETRYVSWSFGDGSVIRDLPIEHGRTISHEFPSSGDYTVEVHLFTVANPIDGVRHYLTTGSLPISVIGPNVPTRFRIEARDVFDGGGAIIPRAVELDASGTTDADGEITKWFWEFGDGSTSDAGPVVEHTYAISGRFNARLTVTDARGATAAATKTVIANIKPAPAFTIRNVPDGGGSPQPFVFEFDGAGSVDADGVITSFRWNFGDDSEIATGQTVQHTFQTPGEYEVVLTVADDLGGVASLAQTADATGDDPFIREIEPTFGEVDTQVDITIRGFNFVAGTTVRLTDATHRAVSAQQVDVPDERRIVARFDLTAVAPGLRTIELTDPTSRTAQLADAFRVVTENLVRMRTSLGDIVVELDPAAAPKTVANFFQYVTDKFYDQTVFHRVVNDPDPFVIQGGAFTSLGEDADPRLKEKAVREAIESEAGNGLSNVRGTIAMALRGSDADSATSQFFINLSDDNSFLDAGTPPFTVFGHVIEGMDVVDAIADVEVGSFNVTTLVNGEERPSRFSDVPVEDVTVLEARRE